MSGGSSGSARAPRSWPPGARGHTPHRGGPMAVDARPRCHCGALFDTVAPDGSRCGAGHWTPREQWAAAAPRGRLEVVADPAVPVNFTARGVMTAAELMA